jgi:hypothetical protein
MVSRELEVSVHALSYLMTIVIQRLHASDPTWSRELLKGIHADQLAASQYGNHAELAGKVFQKAIHMVEQAETLDPSGPPRASSSSGPSDGR